MSQSQHNILDEQARQFYIDVLHLLSESDIPFMVGGAYALAKHAGIERHTKDLDLFVHREHTDLLFKLLSAAGYKTQLTFSHWLGKAYKGEHFIDIIFSSGNAIAEVDEEWFQNATSAHVFGVYVKLCPPEEMIWSKGFIMERERFDGADVAHIIHSCASSLDWERLLRRFGEHWRVLLAHCILFGFIYPTEKRKIPTGIIQELTQRLQNEQTKAPEKLCQGTLLSREQYLVDIERWGYADARVEPRGNMTPQQIDDWTIAIDSK